MPIKIQGINYKKILLNKNEIFIGDDSWIGTNVVIVGNVKIGKHVVIGANAVVTKDIEEYSVAVGNPAKIIKKYSFESNTWEKV